MDAQLIRKARELTGESQTAFGHRFGVDQSTIARWETNGPPRGAARLALSREVESILAAHGQEVTPS
jgi:DNA-binding transcriptional regulator YiaG